MRLRLALLLAAIAVVPASAKEFKDPTALLEALYAPYSSTSDFPEDGARALQSKRLNDLFDADSKEANGEVGRIDFDPYINGQDYEIKDLKIAEPYFAGGKAVVHVTFNNFDTPEDLGYILVNEDGGWKVDDVWSGDKEYPYDLLDILQAPLPQ